MTTDAMNRCRRNTRPSLPDTLDIGRHHRSTRRRQKAAIALAATVIAVLASAGCGGAQSPHAVHLVLTAPTDGAAVSVSNIKVFGTVNPPSAAVVVAGRRAHVTHGVFARWLVLRGGLSHIKVVATAAGYTPAGLNIAVRSSPPTQASTGGAPSASGAIARAANPTPPPARSRYTPRVQATLLRACEAGAGGTAAAVTSCGCFLAYLEAHVSQSTLTVWERAFLKGEATLPRWLRDAALACRKK